MKLVRLIPTGRSQTGARLGYAIRSKNKGSSHVLQITICEDILRQAKVMPDQSAVIAADVKEGIVALQFVHGRANGSAPIKVIAPSRRGNWYISWSGPFRQFFPMTNAMTKLDLIEVTSEHILFKQPKPTAPDDDSTPPPSASLS